MIEQANDKELNIASIYKRFISFLIDGILIYLITFILYIVVYKIKGINLIYILRECQSVYAGLVGWIYFTVCYMKCNGQSIGNKLLNIKVVSLKSNKLEFWQALGRAIFISFFLFIFQTTKGILIFQIQLLLLSLITININPSKKYKQTVWDLGTKSYIEDHRG